jgi:methyl-accepting chemotaxis protein
MDAQHLPAAAKLMRERTSQGLGLLLCLLVGVAFVIACFTGQDLVVPGAFGLLVGVTGLAAIARAPTAMPTRMLVSAQLAVALMLLIYVASTLGDGAVQEAHMMYFVTNTFLLLYMCWRAQILYNVLVVGHHFVMTFAAPAFIWHTKDGLADLVDLGVHAGIAIILVPPLIFMGIYLLRTMVQSDAGLAEVKSQAERADRAMRDAQKSEQEAKDAAARADQTRLAGAQAEVERARVVDAIARALSRLADGHLGDRIDEAFSVDFEALRIDFNRAMEKLQETLRLVSGNTEVINANAAKLRVTAGELSDSTERQAGSLAETVSALADITDRVRQTSASAGQVRDLVGQAKVNSERSSEVVRQAIEAMGGIETSSVQIGQIIGVIDEIAFQTNLLALNAGVEAARAGDAGRGFAVVASEVRALAQRSTQAAKEIKTLISASTEQVSRGVGLVSKTGDALDTIARQVVEINANVKVIADSAGEQARTIGQVNQAIETADKVTKANAAKVEETMATCQLMADETARLSRSVGRFDLADGGREPVRKTVRGRDAVAPSSGFRAERLRAV